MPMVLNKMERRIVPNSDEFLEGGNKNVRHNGLNKSLAYFFSIVLTFHHIIIFIFFWPQMHLKLQSPNIQ